jgi:hypothetical protein
VSTETSVTSAHKDVFDSLAFGGLLVFLLLLPFHLVIKALIPGPIGTYWKEVLLGLLLALWVIQSVRARRPLLTRSGLDWAVLVYLGYLLLRFFLDGPGWVTLWGFYISAMYLPVLWVVVTVLRQRPGRLLILIGSLVGVGAVVAIGGLLEFVLNVPLWPSEEMVRMHGFPGVFIYGTNIRRVYFTFDSPTTLANTLAMMLPLAVSLVLVSQRRLARLAAGVAAGLMAACIVVTFSRGIWVAAVLSLVVMGAWLSLERISGRGFLRRLWRPLAVVAGTLVLIALAWTVVWAVWSPWEDSTYEGVVELSAQAYEQLPISGVEQDLLSLQPVSGESVTQTWSITDPVTLETDERLVLYEHPPESGKSEIMYGVEVPRQGALRFAVALSPEVWSPQYGDGLTFEIYVAEQGGMQPQEAVFVRHINPKENVSDRRWRNYLVDLSPWAGKAVYVSLVTRPGPAGDWRFDWGGWSDLQFVQVPGGYFASVQTESAILRHTSSITDWTGDETNRDRLAAWSQSLDAWRTAPLWGTGLGTTGVAALRTNPGDAFVTESQVLKALIELGPLGLLALFILWFQIGRVGYRTYRATEDSSRRTLLLGVLISLLVVFIEGWVYQNLEVKQVNAYFWTLVGCLAFLAGQVAAARSHPEVATGEAKPQAQDPE